MKPGQLIAGRFEIERQVGVGGMGTVCRARDLETGETVAVKILHSREGCDIERFSREARVLATLRHPGVVRYVAHGANERSPYLVMEWLEGEDLGSRLSRSRLTVAETLALAHRAAEALAAAHEGGIVHRDIKPGNLFLCDGQVEQVKLIDFGIARLTESTLTLTRTGAALGTPGYMAPEQARGLGVVDARADIFSFGCVLFRCLTGERPFTGDHMVAVLAKVLMEEAPRVTERCPEAPDELADLIGSMLCKRPEGRPPDARLLAADFARIRAAAPDSASTPRTAPALRAAAPSSLTAGEQQLMAVLLVGANSIGARPSWRSAEVATVRIGSPPPSTTRMQTEGAVQAIAAAHEAHAERLLDGTLVVTLGGSGAATDQAARAARCALSICSLIPDRPSALAMGRGQSAGARIVGEVIDRAVSLMGAAKERPPRSPRPIPVDELTAGLLDDSFDVARDGPTAELMGARERTQAVRTLLKKPTPCVGRIRELGTLDAIYDHCVSESAAHAVLIDGAEGVGKSRVRHEFLRRLRQRDGSVEIWLGQGNPMSAGAPFGMLVQLLRRGMGLQEGEPLAAQRVKLMARLAPRLSGAELEHACVFLGELLGIPAPDDGGADLRAARQDAALMGDQMRRGWEIVLAAECRVHPVVIVLDDLQWGDLPTVQFIDAALRNLHDLPLMVLALARPEVHELFPDLWVSRAVTLLHVPELSKKACAHLVLSVLGEDTPETLVNRLVVRAAGNAFYLEELIRAAAEGREEELPDTVIAMVQARLNGLPPEARRALRAASIFGVTFWAGGVAELLGMRAGSPEVAGSLAYLIEHEVIAPRVETSFPREREYVFRQSLVREAAYSTLLDPDRVLGHALAGAWLERVGAVNAVVLAEHFERGSHPARAVGWYQRAAEQALEGNEFRAVIARAERGIACGASGEVLGRLKLLITEAMRWTGSYAEAAAHGLDAMRWLPSGSSPWLSAAGEVAIASGVRGDVERLVAVGDELCRVALADELIGEQVVAWARAASWSFRLGQTSIAEALVARIERAALLPAAATPALLARIYYARAHRALHTGDLGTYLTLSEASAQRFEQAGMRRNLCVQRRSVSLAYIELGRYAEAEVSLRATLAEAEQLGLRDSCAEARQLLALALAHQPAPEVAADGGARLARALAFATEGVREAAEYRAHWIEARGRVCLSAVLLMSGELARAEAEAQRAVQLGQGSAPLKAMALAALARVRLARGDAAGALDPACEAMAQMASASRAEIGESAIRLVHAEALVRCGRPEALAAVTEAREALLARASRIRDETQRRDFLGLVPENAATLSLWRETVEGGRGAAEPARQNSNAPPADATSRVHPPALVPPTNS